MAREFNEELMGKVGLDCLRMLDESGLGLIEQYTTVGAMLDALKRAIVFMVVFGDEAGGIMEKLMKADAADAVAEAEDVLKGEI